MVAGKFLPQQNWLLRLGELVLLSANMKMMPRRAAAVSHPRPCLILRVSSVLSG